jgi:hypothetical protein
MKAIFFKETDMNTQISSKLTAFAIALMLNTVILCGVGFLFNAQAHANSETISLAQQTCTYRWLI